MEYEHSHVWSQGGNCVNGLGCWGTEIASWIGMGLHQDWKEHGMARRSAVNHIRMCIFSDRKSYTDVLQDNKLCTNRIKALQGVHCRASTCK